jgi:hyperosmotically inducible periplasmic protein
MKNQVMRTASGIMVVGGLLFAAAPALARGVTARGMTPVAGNTARVAIDDNQDNQLEEAIEKAWKADSKLSARKLDVSVDHGVATISGDVRTAAEKEQAEKLAKVPGITSVKNELKITPADTRSTSEKASSATKAGTEKAVNKTAEAGAKAAEKTSEALGTAADKTKEAAGKTADAASDTWVTTKVKTKLVRDKALKGSKVEVSTTGGIVTLTGSVTSEAAKKRAISLAKATKGVRNVVDQTTVSPSGTR